MAQTVRDFIKEALQIANIVDIYEDTTDSKYLSVGLSTLNREINSLNTVDLWPVSQKEEDFSIASSKKEYTIGPNGDFDTRRPFKIFAIKYKRSNIWYPINEVSNTNWNFSSIDETTTGTPNSFRYLAEEPLGKIEFDVILSDVSELKIIMNNAMGDYLLDDEIIDVDGVSNALLYAVADSLAKRFLRDSFLSAEANKYMTRYKKSKTEAPRIPRRGVNTKAYDYKSDRFL